MFFILSTISIVLLVNTFFDITFSCKFKKHDIIDSDSSEDTNNNDNSSDTGEDVVEEEEEFEECDENCDEDCECNILPELIPLSSENAYPLSSENGCEDIYKCDEQCVCYNLEQNTDIQPEQTEQTEQTEQVEQTEQTEQTEQAEQQESNPDKIVKVDGMTIGY